MIRGNEHDPAVAATMDLGTLKPIDHGKKRVGHPRDRWLPITLKEYWEEVVHREKSVFAIPDFNPNDRFHVEQVRNAANRHKEKYVIPRDNA